MLEDIKHAPDCAASALSSSLSYLTLRLCALQEEPEARWPLLTLARVQEAQATLGQPDTHVDDSQQSAAAAAAADSPASGCSPATPHASQEEAATAEEIYDRLETLDPMRSGYYRDAAAGRARVVLRSAENS